MQFLTVSDLSSYTMSRYAYDTLVRLVRRGLKLPCHLMWYGLEEDNWDNLVEIIKLSGKEKYKITKEDFYFNSAFNPNEKLPSDFHTNRTYAQLQNYAINNESVIPCRYIRLIPHMNPDFDLDSYVIHLLEYCQTDKSFILTYWAYVLHDIRIKFTGRRNHEMVYKEIIDELTDSKDIWKEVLISNGNIHLADLFVQEIAFVNSMREEDIPSYLIDYAPTKYTDYIINTYLRDISSRTYFRLNLSTEELVSVLLSEYPIEHYSTPSYIFTKLESW